MLMFSNQFLHVISLIVNKIDFSKRLVLECLETGPLLDACETELARFKIAVSLLLIPFEARV